MSRRSQSPSGGCGFGCLGLLVLFAVVGRGCDSGGSRSWADTPTSSYSTSTEPASFNDRSFSTLYAQRTVNVRSGPGTRYGIVRTLSPGDMVYVSGADESGWARVGSTISDEYVYRGGQALRPTPPVSRTHRPRRTHREPERAVNPTGATAMCRDGTLSYSAHRRGTCSHHGGVAIWY